MKGDKVVEVFDKCADSGLLRLGFWDTNFNIEEILGRDIQQAMISCTLCCSFRNSLVPPICIKENRQKVRINFAEVLNGKNNVKG